MADRSNPQALPFVAFDRSTQTGSDYLTSLLPRAAAMVLPQGYTAIPVSTYRPGAIAADTGKESMHASGGALDFAILDPNGKPVPGALGQPDTTGHYRNMALAMRQVADPDVQPWMEWGGNFGRVDPVHVDLGGPRGVRGTYPPLPAGYTQVEHNPFEASSTPPITLTPVAGNPFTKEAPAQPLTLTPVDYDPGLPRLPTAQSPQQSQMPTPALPPTALDNSQYSSQYSNQTPMPYAQPITQPVNTVTQ